MQESKATPTATHLVECPFTSLASTTTKDFPITLFLGDLQGRLHIWRRCGQSRLTFKKEQRFVGKGMDEVLQRTLAFTLRRQAGRLTTRLRTMLEQGLDEAHIRKNLIAPLPSQLLRLPSDTSVLYTEWLACFTDQLAVNGAEIESDPFSDLNMKCFRALVGHHSLVTCATVIPEGQIANFPVLITSGWDQRLCFWRLPRGNLLRAVEASMEDEQNPSQMSGEDEEVNNGYAVENAVLDLDYHVGSRTLAYCSANNKVFLQTLSGDLGKFQRPVRVLRGHKNEVNAVCWAELEASSEPTLFSASEDKSIRSWYLTAGLDGRVLLWESRGISSKEPLLRRQSMGTLQTSQSAFDKADSAAARKSTNPVAALLAAARAYKAALKDEHAAANTARP
ncbi:hypothetical protein SprV_0401471300 [Sparganum proliferum]